LGLRENPPLIYCATECTNETKSRTVMGETTATVKSPQVFKPESTAS
jgi:hypothetical protein